MRIPVCLKSMVKVTNPDSQMALGCVLIERDGKADVPRLNATVTDGRRLLNATWEDTDERYCRQDTYTMIEGKRLTEAARVAGSRASYLEIDETPLGVAGDVKITIRAGATSQQVPVVEGRFPRWREVIPVPQIAVPSKTDDDLYTMVSLDAKMLGELMTAIAQMNGNDATMVQLMVPLNGYKAIVVQASLESGIEVKAAQMPMGIDDDGKDRRQFCERQGYQQRPIVCADMVDAVPPETPVATMSPEVAEWLDPDKKLQDAGLVKVAEFEIPDEYLEIVTALAEEGHDYDQIIAAIQLMMAEEQVAS